MQNVTTSKPAQHTPGSWAVTGTSVHSQARNGQNWICQGPNDSPAAPPLAEREANARLIAAAPDLLAALRELIEHSYSPMSGDPATDVPLQRKHNAALAGARAAIAKAEGR